MKKDKHAHLRKEALAVIDRWRAPLFLQEWFFETIFKAEEDHQHGGSRVLAEVSADYVYLKATIYIYQGWFEAPNDVREHALVHELCHCHTQEAWENAGKLRDGQLVTEAQLRETIERLTQRISYIALRGKWRKRA